MEVESYILTSAIRGIFCALLIVVLVVGYNKLFIGRFVKALLESKINSPLSAKTFAELGIKPNFLLSYAMREKGFLRKLVKENKDELGKFYIPEETAYRAMRMYGGRDVDGLMIAFLIILVLAAFALASVLLPGIIDYLISSFSELTT